MIRIGFLFVLLSPALATPEIKPLPPPHPKILQPSSEKVLSVPVVGFYGMARSDSDGNVFVHPGPGFSDPVVVKIIPKSSDAVRFRVPNNPASNLAFYDYSVTPSGTVWILVNPYAEPDLHVFKFDSGGSVKSSLQLEIPPDVQVKNFLALENDYLLVAGFYTGKAPASLHGHSFVGLFDDSGKLARNLKDTLSSVNLDTVDSGSYEGGCAAGEDGNAYLLDKNKIVVLSPGGAITKQIHFVKPSPDLEIEGLYVSGGQAAISLNRRHSDHSVERSFLVVDLSNDETLGWYLPVPEEGHAAVGFSRKEGFVLFSNDHGFIKIVTAPLN